MTQPVDGFTTGDLGAGYWKSNDPRRIRRLIEESSLGSPDAKAARDTAEKDLKPLPQREPGKYADIPEWT